MTQDMLTLDFDRIISQLQEHAVSQAARRHLAETAPIKTVYVRLQQPTMPTCWLKWV